jgi:hypothetical protein
MFSTAWRTRHSSWRSSAIGLEVAAGTVSATRGKGQTDGTGVRSMTCPMILSEVIAWASAS